TLNSSAPTLALDANGNLKGNLTFLSNTDITTGKLILGAITAGLADPSLILDAPGTITLNDSITSYGGNLLVGQTTPPESLIINLSPGDRFLDTQGGEVYLASTGDLSLNRIIQTQGGDLTVTALTIDANCPTNASCNAFNTSSNTGGGDITLKTTTPDSSKESITFAGNLDARGNTAAGGDIRLETEAAKIRFNADNVLTDADIFLISDRGAIETTSLSDTSRIQGRNLTIQTNTSDILLGTPIFSQGGDISLRSNSGIINTQSITLDTDGGDVRLQTGNDILLGSISTNANGAIDGGDITILSGGDIIAAPGTILSAIAIANGGNISLTANADIRTADISSFTSGIAADSGNLSVISTGGSIDTSRGDIATSDPLFTASALGKAGDVNLIANRFLTIGDIEARSLSQNNAGGNIVLEGQTITLAGGTVDAPTVIRSNGIDLTFDAPVTVTDNFAVVLGDTSTLQFLDTINGPGSLQLITEGSATDSILLSNSIGGITPLTAFSIGGATTEAGILSLPKVRTNPTTIQQIQTLNDIFISSRGITAPTGFNAVSAQGNIVIEGTVTSSGRPVTLNADQQLFTSSIDTSSTTTTGGVVHLIGNTLLTTGNINTSSNPAAGGSIALASSAGTITTGDLNSSGITGGDIDVRAEIAIGAGIINSSGSQGDGGNVFLDPIGDIQVSSINAQGGVNGTGGDVVAITDRFFRATGTFSDQNLLTASISTAGGQGGGTTVIRHGGSGVVPFVVGDAATNGTAGVISRGNDTSVRTIAPDSFLFTYTQDPDPTGTIPANGIDAGRLQIISVENPNLNAPVTPPPAPPQPPALVTQQPVPIPTPPVIPEPGLPVSEQPFSIATPPVITESGLSTPQPSVGSLEGIDLLREPNNLLEVLDQLLVSLLLTQELDQEISAEVLDILRTLTIDPTILTTALQTALNVADPSFIYPPSTPFSSLPFNFNLTPPQDPLALVTPLDDLVGLIDQEFEAEYENYSGENLTNKKVNGATVRSSLKTIEQQTGNRSVILYAVSLPDHLDLVLVMPDGPPIRRIVPNATAQRVQAASNLLRNLITDTGSDRYKVPAKAFYDWMIAPFEDQLESLNIDTLIFAMDGGLRLLPVASFYDGQQFLVEKFSVGSIPSMSLTNVRYQDLDGLEVLAMGASEFDVLPPLPAVPTELETVSTEFWSGTSFLNSDFTYDRLDQERKRRDSGILHLATHADFHSTDPQQSFIQLWDQRLKIDDIRQLDWDFSPAVELLVLSACRTAVGDINSELGFAGLAVQTGVKSALASLWYVSDAGTLALMSELY
ncbi:MAG: CHAT domain-containing protein, partial [Prochlorotrichaceae cyanobacterium]